jgi:hypothetical protein
MGGSPISIAQNEKKGVAFLSWNRSFFFNKRVDIAKVRNERNVKQGSIVLG